MLHGKEEAVSQMRGAPLPETSVCVCVSVMFRVQLPPPPAGSPPPARQPDHTYEYPPETIT